MKIVRLFVLLLFATLLTGCFALPANPVPPYLALLTPLLPGASGNCTGTVIAPRQVLTAAHCVKAARRVVTAYGQEAWVTDSHVSTEHDVAILEVDRVLWVQDFAAVGQPELGVQASLWGYCPYMASHVERHAFYNGLVTVSIQDGPDRDYGEWLMIGGKVCGGDSGLAIVQHGKVVGVLSGVDSEVFWVALGSTAYTVPAEYIQELIEVTHDAAVHVQD